MTVADVIRAVEGPLASVRGGPPEEAAYGGAAESLPRVWIAVRASLRSVVEHVTVADIAAGQAAAERSTSSPRTRRPGSRASAPGWPRSRRRRLTWRPDVHDVAARQLELVGLRRG